MPHASCYHCGQPVPEEIDLPVEIDGKSQSMCCVGCQAVAQSIVDSGLSDYYRSRDALPESPREAKPAVLDQLVMYDHADFQRNFVRELGENEREASLLLEGITCAACIWLNEQHVAKLPGILAVDINYATRRARVRWDETKVHLSDILGAVAAIGYRAYPYDAAKNEVLSRRERREAMWRVWVAGFGMMQVMMYAIPAYMADGDMTLDIESLLRWASLLLTLPVILYSAAPFFRNAWRDLCLRRVGMDVPVALGVGAAFAASVWATLIQSGEVYFDSVTMFVFFLLGGRYLEMTARQKAVSVTEALTKLLPAFAQRLPNYPASHEAEQIVVADLAIGDIVLVRPGEHIPADGVVVDGQSSADESLLTGESRAVPKTVGAKLTGGAVNVESPLVMQVEQVGEGTRLSAIVHLMERAASSRPRVVEFADRIAQYFVLALLLIAVGVAAGWYWLDPSRALWITVSVLVVTCPCALSLATPIALTVASGALARDGLLVTKGHAIEALAKATHFVFDKTGTLTTGQMSLLEVLPFTEEGAEACLALAAALEGQSEHPIAQALCRANEATLLVPQAVSSVPGQGVEGELSGRRLRIGRLGFVKVGQSLPPACEIWLTQGDTVVFLADEKRLLAAFRIGDTPRQGAADLVRALRQDGRVVVMLTGDAAPTANKVAADLGIDEVVAEATPADKHAHIHRLQQSGAIVAMVGDGVNDAPVLAQAQVSVAMGGGAALARAQADFVLLSERLDVLYQGWRRARATFQIIRQNLGWSFFYNFAALPLAIMGYVPPWLAGIGMSASSLLVVMNSLRIQRLGAH